MMRNCEARYRVLQVGMWMAPVLSHHMLSAKALLVGGWL